MDKSTPLPEIRWGGLFERTILAADTHDHLHDAQKPGAHLKGIGIGDVYSVFLLVDRLEFFDVFLGKLHAFSISDG